MMLDIKEEKKELLYVAAEYEAPSRPSSSNSYNSQSFLIPTSETGHGNSSNIDVLSSLRSILIRFFRALNWKSLLVALLPSCVRPAGVGAKTKLHPTSWLDGLRGVAAFIVFIHHFALAWFPGLAWGYGSRANAYNFFQVPFIRIIFSGRGMVSIFFLLSGYVLSHSSLLSIRSRNDVSLLSTLSSSISRRFIRLFSPTLISTIISLLLARCGFWIAPWGGPGKQGAFFAQVRGWWDDFVKMSNPVMGIDARSTYRAPYGFQLWTIPREWRGSLGVYLVIVGTCRMKTAARMAVVVGLGAYFVGMGEWDLGLFMVGMVMAEMQIIRREWALKERPGDGGSIPTSEDVLRLQNTIRHALTVVIALLGIHCLTFPDEAANTTPGYGWMVAHTPTQYSGKSLIQRFWLFIGAVLFVGACCFSPSMTNTSDSTAAPLLQKLFITPFAQYLGNISYALYVTHPWLSFNLGRQIQNLVRRSGTNSYVAAFLFALVVITCGCLWVADLFWRAVDRRSVLFGKWLAENCFVK